MLIIGERIKKNKALLFVFQSNIGVFHCNCIRFFFNLISLYFKPFHNFLVLGENKIYEIIYFPNLTSIDFFCFM